MQEGRWRMAGKFDAAIKDLMWRGMPALLGFLVGSPVARFLRAVQFPNGGDAGLPATSPYRHAKT
jgi:hypothetical protein